MKNAHISSLVYLWSIYFIKTDGCYLLNVSNWMFPINKVPPPVLEIIKKS